VYIIINKDKEEWIRLKAYDITDEYEISNYGNIRKCLSKKIIHSSVCMDGYKRVKLKTKSGHKYSFLVHRLVALMFVNNYNVLTGKIIVNHLDSIRSHCYYENLEWVTYAENIIHGYEHGHILEYSERKPIYKKYDDNTVHTICKYLEQGFSPSQIYDKLPDTIHTKKSISDLINRIKTTNIEIYDDIISKYNIPKVNKPIILNDDFVETVCELLSKGYYTEDIISILNIPNELKKKYQKNICDIKCRRTFLDISLKYIFPPHIYSKKPAYPLNSILEICDQLQNNVAMPKITDYILIKYNISDRTRLRDFIYDIKRRRIHIDISNHYTW